VDKPTPMPSATFFQFVVSCGEWYNDVSANLDGHVFVFLERTFLANYLSQ
jgi:hypothetical protein